MPKKSKRRAKTSGGGGGSGKARESGGREGNGGGSASAAKNSADANNRDGDDEAGILTAGAIRVLTKRGANKEHSLHSFAGKYAPTLQLVGDIERVGEDSFTFCLSDGEHCIWAIASRRVNGESFNFLATGQLTMHSIICLRSYLVSYNALHGCDVVGICRAAVVETKVDGMIGSPTFLGAPCIEAPAVDAAVGDTPSSPAECVPYPQRLEIARGILAKSFDAASRGDLRLIAKQCCDALSLPRNLTEGFRSVFIMDYSATVENALSDLITEQSDQTRAVETYMGCIKSYGRFFKSIASDMSESIDTRVMAVYACCLPSAIFAFTNSNDMNYLRRFVDMSKQVSLHDLPAPFELGGHPCLGGKRVSLDVVSLFLDMIKIARMRLETFGGLATPEIPSGLSHTCSDLTTSRYFRTFGGVRCDNCGASPGDAGIIDLLKCNSCRLAWYCSESCQAESWSKGHRHCCKKFGSFQSGDFLVLFGLKKSDLNLSIVKFEGCDVNGRLKVMIVVSGTQQGSLQTIGSVSDGRVQQNVIGYRLPTSYAEGMVISVKKENLRHCRPLK